MEFKIIRDTFLDGIQKTLGIVEKKTTIPILNNILLKADANKIKIIATDREIILISDYDAEVLEKGEITVSAKKLYEMIREIQGENITFVQKNNIVKISAQRAFYKIPGLPAEDFPSITDDQDMMLHKLEGSIIKDLINKTSFAMATDETRKNLNGVLLEEGMDGVNHLLRMVATDGHRLALAKSLTPGHFFKAGKGVIIPRKGLMEIKKIIDENEDLKIGLHKNMFILQTKNTILKVSLVDADYPDYKKVIPAEKGIIVTLERESFLHALRRMSVVSSERYGGVILSFTKGKLTLNSTNLDVGEATEEIDIDYDGEAIDSGFNVNYLIDAISVVNKENIVFEVGMGLKPSMIKQADDDNYLCIVMPLKI
ncbi:MAG TPA: DNA polymerase III subunit beta [Smithella sp.]|nr:DNA polymerase III subunit beta [Smithella sp.]HOG90426.1 DNA polymerase III subunit beta [Smithella sp.]HOU51903.1 DNA polymerase III subunit beta [Smithella sp.]HQH17317.1 DNA polymerase III subunit beta [Smithella sp.]HQI71691.1 DNA polymerase III subunit beta [Smithella sp.]